MNWIKTGISNEVNSDETKCSYITISLGSSRLSSISIGSEKSLSLHGKREKYWVQLWKKTR